MLGVLRHAMALHNCKKMCGACEQALETFKHTGICCARVGKCEGIHAMRLSRAEAV